VPRSSPAFIRAAGRRIKTRTRPVSTATVCTTQGVDAGTHHGRLRVRGRFLLSAPGRNRPRAWRNRRNPPRLLQDPGASDSSVFAPAAAPTPEQRFARPKSTYGHWGTLVNPYFKSSQINKSRVDNEIKVYTNTINIRALSLPPPAFRAVVHRVRH
jgi:hypothetical protein